MKRFITFEGIDGSGKTTICNNVFDTLQLQGYKVRKTFEPTDSLIGACAQQYIKIPADPFVAAFAMLADRFIHSKEIQQWLDDGYIVLCDRYAESTYAYQGVQLQEHIKTPIKWLQELSKGRIIPPDRTFLFDIDPQDAMKRIQQRKELIPFEQVSFLKKVQKNYLLLANGEQFKVMDATTPISKLTEVCLQDILL
jgi:dTMP kinase